MVVDEIVWCYGFLFWCCRFQGEMFEGMFGVECVILFKLMIYMNEFGCSVQEVVGFFKIVFGDVIVFYDEFELLLGKVCVKIGGGIVGYNGLCLILVQIGNDYCWVWFGIGYFGVKELVYGYVLLDFVKVDNEWVMMFCDVFVEYVVLVVKGIDVIFVNCVYFVMQVKGFLIKDENGQYQ